MVRDPVEQEPPDAEPPPPGGQLSPLGPGPIAGSAVLGLVLGWLWHPVAERVTGTAPTLSWTQPAVLFFVAAILGAVAWLTWRAVHVRGERLEPHQAVNRLVLARACILVGALVGGAYAGYAVSWLGSRAELADERIWRSAACVVAGGLIVVTGKLLERACRVPNRDPHP